MAARRPAGARRAPSTAESIRALGVVLERIESQMIGVIEAVTSSSERLDAKIDGVESRLLQRITTLEEAVRENSVDIQKNSQDIQRNSRDIQKNTEDIVALRNEVALLRHDFDHREERGRMDALEARVAALEARVGVD